MIFSTPGQAILIAHERHSRITIAMRQSSLKADPVADALVGMLHTMPNALKRSITFDNGTEFNRHHRKLQQYTQKMPRLPYSSRNLSTVALQM